ncbi:hypothetical protein ACFU96_24630 [Streptomyces sp. NPDC057620]|uniref:hypothetical protein n=1 Tax=Streptomyces sp. NPDC057620 TaxID=3346185 RepID=UPI00369499D0
MAEVGARPGAGVAADAGFGGFGVFTALAAVAVAAVVTVAAALALVVGVGAARAHAAVPGPDGGSPNLAVVVAGDGTGRTTSVSSGEPDFAQLWQLTGPTSTGTERVPQDWLEGRFPAVRATVIWGTTGVGGWPETDSAPGGDIFMGRQDQVFLAKDGTPWIRSDPALDVNDDDIRWHRAPRSVYDQVQRRELFGSGPVVGDGSRSGDRAWWAAPGLSSGLAAGVVLGSGGTLLIRRAAAGREPGPPRESRQELIDL